MYLVDYFFDLAKNSVWANQHADRHAIFKLHLLSTFTGVKQKLSLPFLDTHLPDWPALTNNKTYIVYEVGGIDKDTVGIDNTLADWNSLASLIVDSKMFAIAFIGHRLFNLSKTYIRITSDGTMIMAVERESNLSRLSEKLPVYLRLYSNVETLTTNKVYKYENVIVDKVNGSFPYNTYNDMRAGLYDAMDNGEEPLVFLDGLLLAGSIDVSGFMPVYAALSNVSDFEIITDPEIINFITINKSDFTEFYSTKDKVDKYIACSPEDSDNMYVDDVEFFISGIGSGANSIRVALYMPRLYAFQIRQLSFKDWSFNKSVWNSIEAELIRQVGFPLSDFQLHVIVRNSGQQIHYIQDSNRIPDLMNLPASIRKQCFINTDESMDIWKASILETCPFNTWLGLPESQVTKYRMQNIFSSYGAVRVVEGVTKGINNANWKLPLIIHDSGGTLLRFPDGLKQYSDSTFGSLTVPGSTYANGIGSEIFIPNKIVGGNLDILVIPGETETTVLQEFGIFCYYNNHVSLQKAIYETDYTYEDVGDDTIITWKSHMLEYTRYVRTANKYVYWKRELTSVELDEGFDIYDGRSMRNDIGMGKAMIWFKGRYLVEGLDYVVQFSKVHLCSKHEWQEDAGGYIFEVLYYGLPDNSLKHSNHDEYGFLARGKISYNERYDLYSNRHRAIVAAGRILTPNEVFAAEDFEELNNSALDTEIFKDGLPWTVVNLPSLIRSEELEMFSIPQLNDKIIDNRIETFLSEIYPQATDPRPILISSKYDLYSPFINKIMQDIIDLFITIPDVTLSDEDIDTIVTPYKHLIPICPSQRPLDFRYVHVHPIRSLEPITVDMPTYWFINKINKLYLNNKILFINRYLQIV